MKILVLGAAGMVGRKFVERLARDGNLGGKPIEHATLHDIVVPVAPAGAPFASTCLASDFSLPGEVEKLVAGRPDLIVHLAAIVSGEAEADFEKGYRINLDGTLKLFEAIRAIGDGDGTRLPTVCVRPGKPNKAASGFFSNIIREPLVGQEAVLPVSEDVMHWHASPRSAVGFLIHAAMMRIAAGGSRCNLAKRATDLGFRAERTFEEIIRIHIEDELGGRIGG